MKVSVLFLSLVSLTYGDSDPESGDTGEVYKIEGKVTPPDNPAPDWLSVTTVTIDGGVRRAFLKEDNSFAFQVCFQYHKQDPVSQHYFIIAGPFSWQLPG